MCELEELLETLELLSELVELLELVLDPIRPSYIFCVDPSSNIL